MVRDPEHALNGFMVTDAYLNVRLLEESRVFIDRIALDENTSHRIDWWKSLVLPDAVKHFDHRAIQIAPETVFVIDGGFIAARVGEFHQRLV